MTLYLNIGDQRHIMVDIVIENQPTDKLHLPPNLLQPSMNFKKAQGLWEEKVGAVHQEVPDSTTPLLLRG